MGKLDHSRVDAKHMLKLNYFKNVLYFALNFLPREILLVKKWEIEKTKTSFIISVLKVKYWVVLVF